MAGAAVASSSNFPPISLCNFTSVLPKSKPSFLPSPPQHAKLRSHHSGFSVFNCWLLQQQVPPAPSRQFRDHLLSSSHAPTLLPISSRVSGTDTPRRLEAFSTNSAADILKPNRKSPYGRPISMYNDEEYDDDEEEESDDGDDDDDEEFDDEYSDSEEFDDDIPGRQSSLRKRNKKNSTNAVRNVNQSYRQSNYYENDAGRPDMIDSPNSNVRGKLPNGEFVQSSFDELREELDFKDRWLPLLEYLTTLGLKESDIISMYEKRFKCLQISVSSAKERIQYLLGVGVKQRDLRKLLIKMPQILECPVESNIKPHVAFLRGIGISDARIGQIICDAPTIFSHSIELSLKPRVRYLVEEIGIKESDIGKIVQLSPTILLFRVEKSWKSRLRFLSKELGAPRSSVVKMVTKHPQFLNYSIEDGIKPRIDFLRSIGMQNPDILKVLTSLTQVLSLSLEDNLKPKYLYLVNELNNKAHSLTKYPTYLSLSLEQRIKPRHMFLVSLKRAPKGPFPLKSFVPTDEFFCQRWAGTSVEKYLAFKQRLLNDVGKKYGSRR